MTLGSKLLTIRRKFGLSQENLAGILNVSRQAITKWENELGLPDIDNLKNIAKTFGVSIDYLLSNDELPLLVMRIQLDKNKYKNKIDCYEQTLSHYFPGPWKIYVLTRSKKMGMLESTFDFLIGAGTVELADGLNDLSPYYLAKKDQLNLLINIKDWILEVKELPSVKNSFQVDNNKFKVHHELIFNK